MERHFEQELDELRRQLLVMGGRVKAITGKAITALEQRDRALAEEVFDDDRAIDQLEIDIDEQCVQLLALQQPVAGDLRFVTSALMISKDLERVGDHAVNIAGAAKRLTALPEGKHLFDIPRMETVASAMLSDALEAFVGRDTERARAVCRRDDEVDRLNREIFRELMADMLADRAAIARSVDLILVARNLERIGDLATNIAEEVVFITEARVIKHHAEG